MDTQKLRQRILDLAIRGKLVPQDPNDEPASVLLERIRAEKERLIAEGKIKRPKKSKASSSESHYQNFTPPFEIPDSWEWVRLEDIIRVKSGENLNVRELQSKNRFPIYGGNGINGYYDRYNVAKDTIIIGRVGFYCGSIHKTKSESWVTDNALIVDSYPINIDIDWLCLVLTWSNLRKTSNSTAQPVVSGKSIYPIYVPLPPKSEQNRIVNTFDVVKRAIGIIETSKNSIQDLIQLTKSKILNLAMQGKLVPQDPTDEPAADMLRRINPKAKIITDNPHLRNIPKEWCWVKLKDICIKIVDGDHNPPMGQTIDTGFYMISASNIVNDDITIRPSRFITEEQFNICNNRTNVAKGDVLLTTVGSIGRTAIFSLESNITFQRSVSVISTLILNSYLKIFLDSPNTQKYMIENAKGTAQKGFYINQLCSLPIPIPSMKEQQRIVAKIEELYSVLDKIEASLQS